MAGFDGFSTDVDKNYYDNRLKRPVSKEQAEKRNERAKQFLEVVKKEIQITYITELKKNFLMLQH